MYSLSMEVQKKIFFKHRVPGKKYDLSIELQEKYSLSIELQEEMLFKHKVQGKSAL